MKSRMHMILFSILPIAITGLYSYTVIPYGLDKWMNSQNYAAGDFGKFLCFSPILVLTGIVMLQLVAMEIKWKK